MADWGFPDAASEEALHKSRVLNVEEKPFRRLTKRLLTEPSPLFSLSGADRTSDPASNGAESDESTAEPSDETTSSKEEAAAAERRQLCEDVRLDFAAFDSSILRIQFLRQSNVKERERYAAEKIKIEDTASNVRENTMRLRSHLDEAQKLMATRKTYDELANTITSNKALKPRDEQQVNIEQLKSEIEELERESREYDQVWGERREQFAQVVNEGARLRRQIRDEKEEPDAPLPETDEMLDVDTVGGRRSNVGTPRPRDATTPMYVPEGSGARTPRSRMGTPLPEEATTRGPEGKAMDAIPEVVEKGDEDMEDEGEVAEETVAPAISVPEGGSTQPGASQTEKSGDQMDTS